MLSCFIIDYEAHAAQALKAYINQCGYFSSIDVFNSTLDALEKVREGHKPDVVFIDVEIPELSGIDFAKMLPKEIAIIYITASTQQILTAFETNVYDYMLKPVSFSRFLLSVEKVKFRFYKKLNQVSISEYMFINPGIKGKVVRVKFSEIEYVEGLKNYVVIHHSGVHQITYLTMHETEDALPANMFIRIHKSFIINLFGIMSIEGNSVTLSNKLKLPIGPTFKSALFQLIDSQTVSSRR